MRVYAEPDTEESELGFRLFCVRKWTEIWGGDNNCQPPSQNEHIIRKNRKSEGLKARKVLWVFFYWIKEGQETRNHQKSRFQWGIMLVFRETDW